jgi:hypothetical protein
LEVSIVATSNESKILGYVIVKPGVDEEKLIHDLYYGGMIHFKKFSGEELENASESDVEYISDEGIIRIIGFDDTSINYIIY